MNTQAVSPATEPERRIYVKTRVTKRGFPKPIRDILEILRNGGVGEVKAGLWAVYVPESDYPRVLAEVERITGVKAEQPTPDMPESPDTSLFELADRQEKEREFRELCALPNSTNWFT